MIAYVIKVLSALIGSGCDFCPKSPPHVLQGRFRPGDPALEFFLAKLQYMGSHKHKSQNQEQT